jgi:nitronate monooxygenase
LWPAALTVVRTLRGRNADAGQFCIDQQLGHALKGELDKGLFFRSASRLPFGEDILPVKALMDSLLGGVRPMRFNAPLAAVTASGHGIKPVC